MRRSKHKDERSDEGFTATLAGPEDALVNDQELDEPERIPDVVVHLNYVLLLWSVGIFAVAAVAVHVNRGYQLRMNAHHIRERAENAEAQADIDAAVKHWTRYLNFQRDHSSDDEAPLIETIVHLANLIHDRAKSQGDSQKALSDYLHVYNYLEEALRKEPERHAERERLIEVCMKLGDVQVGYYREALQHLGRLFQAVDGSTDNPVLLRELAQSQWALREFRAAQKSYARLIACNSADCESYVALAQLLLTAPEKTCTQTELTESLQAEIELPSPEPGSFVVTAFPPENEDGRSVANSRTTLRTVDALLNLLVEHGQPLAEAHRHRAVFLAEMKSTMDDSPLDAAAANRRVSALFGGETNADQDADGALSAEETRAIQVPPFADSNRDGRIDKQELAKSLISGGRISRLEQADRSIQEALAQVDKVGDEQAQTSIFTAAAGVYRDYAEALLYEDRTRAGTYMHLARDAAERAVATSRQAPQAVVALAQLELGVGQFELAEAARKQRLDNAEKLLRSARETLHEETAAQASGQSPQAQLSADAELMLGMVLLNQMGAAQEGDRESPTIEIRDQIIPSLESHATSAGAARYLEGALLYHERQWSAAEQKLRAAVTAVSLNSNLTRQVSLLRAQCAGKLGDLDGQVARILAVHRADPNRSDGRIALAESYAAADNIDGALAEYGPYWSNALVTPRYIRLLFQRELRKPAEERDWGPAADALKVLGEQEENRAEFPLLRADFLYWQAYTAQQVQQSKGGDELSETVASKLKEAYDVLADAVDESPQDVDRRVALCGLMVRRFDLTPAQRAASCHEILQTALDVIGDHVKLRIATAQAALLLPKEQAFPVLADLKAQENQTFTAEDRALLRENLAAVYGAHGGRAEAIEAYVEAARLLPTELKFPQTALELIVGHILENKGHLGDQQANWNEMLKRLEVIESGDPPIKGSVGPYSAYYQATAIVLQAPVDAASRKPEALDKAQTLLRKAQQARPKWSAVPRMLGELATFQHVQSQQAGDVSQFQETAVAHFEDAIELGDYSESIVGRVVEYYIQNRREDDALKLQEIVSRKRPQALTSRLATLARTLEERTGEKTAALDKYIALAEAANGRAADKIRAAYMLMSRRDAGPRTEELLREACELEPTLPGPWEHLVRYLAGRRRIDEARDQIDEAEQALPDEPAELKPRTLAHCFQLLRNSDPAAPQKWAEQAERYYRAAIGAAPKNIALQQDFAQFYMEGRQLDLAGETIKTILDPSSGASPQARDWALTHQALIAGSTGDPLAALGTLKTAQPVDDQGRIANLRAQLAIYTQRNQATDQGDMRTALEDLHKLTGGRLTPRERLQLATVSQSQGDWRRAHEIYREWIDSAPRDPGPLALLAESLIRHDGGESQSIAESRTRWETLHKLEPDTYRTHALEARLVAAEGRPDEAASQLSEFVVKFADAKLDDVFVQVQKATAAEDAVKLLSKARANLNDPTVSAELAKAQQIQNSGDDKQALEVLHRLANAQAAVVNIRKESLHNAAGLLEELGELEAAEKLFLRFAEQSPQADAPLELARFLARHDRIDEALDLCRTHWDAIPPETVGGLVAAIFRTAGTTDPDVVRPFIEKLEKSVDQAPDDNARISRLFEVANFHDLLQNYDAAEAAYSRIIQIKPDEVVSANNLAFLWARRGKNLPQALELINHQVAAFGQSAELLDTKAVVLMCTGKAAEAAELLKGVTEKVPSALYYLHQAEAQSAAGQRLEAKQSLKKAADQGLKEKDLHPFDLAAYQSLQKKLGG